jgi:hypothetical protein
VILPPPQRAAQELIGAADQGSNAAGKRRQR